MDFRVAPLALAGLASVSAACTTRTVYVIDDRPRTQVASAPAQQEVYDDDVGQPYDGDGFAPQSAMPASSS